MRVLIIDNYDSFTYNLYQLAGDIMLQDNVTNVLDVCRNDKISLNGIGKKYDKVILSPGPGNPADKAYFGVCADILLNPQKDIPVFGVCLGMQGIAHYFGGNVIRATHPMHGKTSPIKHDAKGAFKNIPQNIEVMRYHSLIVERNSLPECLEITAYTDDASGEIMGLRHKDYPIEGIQFHPESFATQEGNTMLKNFLLS
jgi:anthranilate synthase component 2